MLFLVTNVSENISSTTCPPKGAPKKLLLVFVVSEARLIFSIGVATSPGPLKAHLKDTSKDSPRAKGLEQKNGAAVKRLGGVFFFFVKKKKLFWSQRIPLPLPLPPLLS